MADIKAPKQLEKAADGTITLMITLPKEEVEKAREEAVVRAIENVELPGFRKGKAPRNMVEGKLDPLKLQEDILRTLLPEAYTKAVTEHKLKPIMSPKIQIQKLEEGKDWQFNAITCEAPEVTLGDYKEAVKTITAKSKIALPGKEQKEVTFDELMQAVLEKAKVTVPTVLLEAEVDRLLSQMLDEVKSLGLSLEQYLASTHKSVDEVRKEYENRARHDATIEFVLQKIADDEKILVSAEEVADAIAKAQNPAEKENLERNQYLLAAILRQQKTFDFLKNL